MKIRHTFALVAVLGLLVGLPLTAEWPVMEKGKIVDAPYRPAVQDGLDLVDPVPTQLLLKWGYLLEAGPTRLRPILMTTAAMVLGVVPLVIAAGAGAAGRHAMGLVIFSGLSIGTLFTLFVVPAVYMLLAADHHAQRSSAGAGSDAGAIPVKG